MNNVKGSGLFKENNLGLTKDEATGNSNIHSPEYTTTVESNQAQTIRLNPTEQGLLNQLLSQLNQERVQNPSISPYDKVAKNLSNYVITPGFQRSLRNLSSAINSNNQIEDLSMIDRIAALALIPKLITLESPSQIASSVKTINTKEESSSQMLQDLKQALNTNTIKGNTVWSLLEKSKEGKELIEQLSPKEGGSIKATDKDKAKLAEVILSSIDQYAQEYTPPTGKEEINPFTDGSTELFSDKKEHNILKTQYSKIYQIAKRYDLPIFTTVSEKKQ